MAAETEPKKAAELDQNKEKMLISSKFNVHSSFDGYQTHKRWLNHHSKQQHQGSIDINDKFSDSNEAKVSFHQNPTQARN